MQAIICQTPVHIKFSITTLALFKCYETSWVNEQLLDSGVLGMGGSYKVTKLHALCMKLGEHYT